MNRLATRAEGNVASTVYSENSRAFEKMALYEETYC